jgi:hypothetical protein
MRPASTEAKAELLRLLDRFTVSASQGDVEMVMATMKDLTLAHRRLLRFGAYCL